MVDLVWWHDNFFVRGEEGSVADKDFVSKMQIQVLIAAVDEMGGVCFAGTLMKYYFNILQESIMLGRLCY